MRGKNGVLSTSSREDKKENKYEKAQRGKQKRGKRKGGVLRKEAGVVGTYTQRQDEKAEKIKKARGTKTRSVG